MLIAGTPITQSRAAIVQDLYRLAFCRQLEATGVESAGDAIGPESIAGLLHDLAQILDETHHPDDAALLESLAFETAPRSGQLAR